jgi:hypothetical protein
LALHDDAAALKVTHADGSTTDLAFDGGTELQIRREEGGKS